MTITTGEWESLQRVLYTDYISSDNEDSPEISLNDVLGTASLSEVSVSANPEMCLQAVENPDYPRSIGSKWYKCHLISQTNLQYKNDPDNILYASWPFHQIFDRMNIICGVGAAIQFESFAGVEDVEVALGRFERRTKLMVRVIFRTADHAHDFGWKLKNGTERINDLEYRSFLYARDGEKMRFCIDVKYEETARIWRLEDGLDE